uniref:SH3 and cysteine-rich domain-containing protein 3 n=1 Tax=Cacopsylla melanoneura TaxID=428564 RepID=A0A8D8VID2_9HEMI
MYEQHAAELQLLVNNFRKKNAELRKERLACPSSLFHTWETLLQEVETDSQAHIDIASVFGRQVSRPLLERSFHRKVQARKVFGHRESFEILINKAEEKLSKARQDYKNAYMAHLSAPNNTAALANYIDAHNNYVTQLHATNAMVDQYSHDVLPSLLQELDEVYSDLCTTLSDSVQQGSEVISSRATEQTRRYDNLSNQCRNVVPSNDLAHFVKSISPLPAHPHPSHRLRVFSAPQAPTIEQVDAAGNTTTVPDPNFQGIEGVQLKNELVIDRLASLDVKSRYESLRNESAELEAQIKQLQDALDTLSRIQQRSLESSLFNKANEIQEDISIKKFDLKNAQLHLASIKAQKDLFTNKIESAGTEPASSGSRDRKMSSSSQGSMKSKWLKAFKSLKTPAPSNGNSKDQEKKNQMYHAVSTMIQLRKTGKDGLQLSSMDTSHQFQEYTYKKITPCDMCSQVLRGHTRQGLKCRLCKTNIHVDCQDKVPAKCQPKSRLLRRQKSTSEIETRVTPATQEEEGIYSDISRQSMSAVPFGAGGKIAITPPSEVDTIYQVLKTANEISTSRAGSANSMAPPLAVRRNQQIGSNTASKGPSTLAVVNAPVATSSAPHSPRRQKLNLRMKSLSLDSPESTEHAQRRRGVVTTSQTIDPHSSQSSSSRVQSPSSPVHNRRLLSARNMRMSSVELPDDNEKSLSSASTSPCPSPVRMKAHRLLPTNLFVVLYNFKSRHADELDLKPGYKVTVIDTSDQNWWKGKCMGRVGYFPSNYVIKVQPGERPLQVTHNLQIADGESGLSLLRDQIVIQIGDEVDGMVMIRNGDNRQGVCPLKYLQEV